MLSETRTNCRIGSCDSQEAVLASSKTSQTWFPTTKIESICEEPPYIRKGSPEILPDSHHTPKLPAVISVTDRREIPPPSCHLVADLDARRAHHNRLEFSGRDWHESRTVSLVATWLPGRGCVPAIMKAPGGARAARHAEEIAGFAEF